MKQAAMVFADHSTDGHVDRGEQSGGADPPLGAPGSTG